MSSPGPPTGACASGATTLLGVSYSMVRACLREPEGRALQAALAFYDTLGLVGGAEMIGSW
jgi:hypothetical protein